MDTTASTMREHAQFEFTGQTDEYFRIWIVNLALTIATLGIYSAWATVRKKRYFYTNTRLSDGHFDYHGNPKAILFGRLIALSALAAYSGSTYLTSMPYLPAVILLLVFLGAPWLIVRSRRFQLRMSSFRGIRFNFKGSTFDAFRTHYGAALLTAVTLGLLTASANFMRARYAIANSAFGTTSVDFGATKDAFYEYFWKSAGLGVLVVIAYFFYAMLVGAMAGQFAAPVAEDEMPGMGLQLAMYSIFAFLLLGYAAVGVYYQVRIRNHLLNTSSIAGNTLVSKLEVGRMLWLYLSNLLAIVFSLGLATPWAQIRLARYRAERTSAVLTNDWDVFVQGQAEATSAIGDEIGEAFDVDVGLGF